MKAIRIFFKILFLIPTIIVYFVIAIMGIVAFIIVIIFGDFLEIK